MINVKSWVSNMWLVVQNQPTKRLNPANLITLKILKIMEKYFQFFFFFVFYSEI